MIKLKINTVTGGTMKKFFKGTGAAIGYLTIYFVIILLVVFTGGIYFGIKEG